MNVYKLIIASLFVFRVAETKAQSCNCASNLDAIINCVEENYAGFDDKVNKSTAKVYKNLKKDLKKKAGNIPLNYSCLGLLNAYISFFDDPHLGLRRMNKTTENKAYWNSIFNQIGAFDTRNLDTLNHRFSNLWENETSDLLVKIGKSGTRYYGYTRKGDNVAWFPGQLKFEFDERTKEAIFYNRNHLPFNTQVLIYENEISFGKFGRFERRPDSQSVFTKRVLFKTKKYNDSVFYIKLGGFDNAYNRVIDSMVSEDSVKISHAKHLIIDITDNSGGNIYAYRSLLIYLLDSSFMDYGSKLRVGRGNINHYYESSKDTTMNPDVAKALFGMGKLLENAGKARYIDFGYNRKIQRDIPASDKKVYVLMNERSVSAAEYLVETAAQCDHCTLVGRPSPGTIDYVNNNGAFKLPCEHLQLAYPTLRSNRVDEPGYVKNQGYAPQIPLTIETALWPDYLVELIAKGLKQ